MPVLQFSEVKINTDKPFAMDLLVVGESVSKTSTEIAVGLVLAFRANFFSFFQKVDTIL